MIISTTGRVHNGLILPKSLLEDITRTLWLDYYGLGKHSDKDFKVLCPFGVP